MLGGRDEQVVDGGRKERLLAPSDRDATRAKTASRGASRRTLRLPGYVLTERLIEYLREFHPGEASYVDAYVELIYHLRDSVEADHDLPEPEREYLRQLTLGMAAWHAAVADVIG
jgi:hypothetical protein